MDIVVKQKQKPSDTFPPQNRPEEQLKHKDNCSEKSHLMAWPQVCAHCLRCIALFPPSCESNTLFFLSSTYSDREMGDNYCRPLS